MACTRLFQYRGILDGRNAGVRFRVDVVARCFSGCRLFGFFVLRVFLGISAWISDLPVLLDIKLRSTGFACLVSIVATTKTAINYTFFAFTTRALVGSHDNL